MKKKAIVCLLSLMMVLAGFGCTPNRLMKAEKGGEAAASVLAESATKPDAEPTSTPSPTPAPDSGDYEYIRLADGTAQITGYSGDVSDLAIPTALDGVPVTSIGDRAFSGRSSLTSVTIPDSVTTIGRWAFQWCDSLTSVTIPDSITTIGVGAFYMCSSLTGITIPDSVVSLGSNPFAWCSELTSIRVSPDHPALAVIDDVLFEKAGKKLVCYPVGKTGSSYAVPQGIQCIGSAAFSDCDSLTNITIPDSVTTISDGAFQSCSSLTSVTILDSVTTIGDGAFYMCSSLTGITIPDSVTTIGYMAFSECDSLTSVGIPDSVTIIGDDAFYGCDSLTATVGRESYAAQYCKENGIPYTYADGLDWLNN